MHVMFRLAKEFSQVTDVQNVVLRSSYTTRRATRTTLCISAVPRETKKTVILIAAVFPRLLSKHGDGKFPFGVQSNSISFFEVEWLELCSRFQPHFRISEIVIEQEEECKKP